MSTPRLPRSAWVDAAYTTFVREGLSRIRVEAVARELGVTKGSFYWHFAQRRDLVEAVVAQWENHATESVIARAEDTTGGPDARLQSLFHDVALQSRRDSGEQSLYLEAAGEGVTEAVARVTARRIDYVAGLLIELGQDPAEAHRRATAVTAAAVGLAQLRAVLPERERDDVNALVSSLVEMVRASPAPAGQAESRTVNVGAKILDATAGTVPST